MARKLDEERVRLQQEISIRLEEEHARQVAEKDKRLLDAMKVNDELRRKLQQGSQQLQGEVLELALENLLAQTFPSDPTVIIQHDGRDVDKLPKFPASAK
jgi:hypothetical protein